MRNRPKRRQQKSDPEVAFLFASRSSRALKLNMAQRTGLEPATPGVTGRYSNRLNYRCALWTCVLFTAFESPRTSAFKLNDGG